MEELTNQLKENLRKPFHNWSTDIFGGKMCSITTDEFFSVKFYDDRIPPVNHAAFYYMDDNHFPITTFSDRPGDAREIIPTKVDTVFKNEKLGMTIWFVKDHVDVPAKLVASEIERPHAFSWAVGLVKEWTLQPKRKQWHIDYSEADAELVKNLPYFLDQIKRRIHLNDLYLNYKNKAWKN